MTQRFIKFIPSEEAEFLLANHPNAFLLLTLIAMRARRVSGKPDGLEIGECHIGDYDGCGLSRKQYRTALSHLSLRGHVKIIETCRTRQKSATGRATVGTKVKLLKSGIWDINEEQEGHQIGHRGATDGPPMGHEQERIRTNKKEKEIKESITDAKSVDIRSILSSDRKEEEICLFRSYAESKLLPMPIRDAQIWFSQFLSPYIYEIFDLLAKEVELIRGSNGKKKPIKNYLAWMQRALDRNYPKINAQSRKCMELALHFQHNGWPNLQVRTRYAVDEELGKDFYYDHENCEFMLTREYEKVIGL